MRVSPQAAVSASSTLCLAECGIAQTYRWPLARVKYTGSVCYKERVTGLEIKRILLLQAAARLGPMAGTRVLTKLE